MASHPDSLTGHLGHAGALGDSCTMDGKDNRSVVSINGYLMTKTSSDLQNPEKAPSYTSAAIPVHGFDAKLFPKLAQ